MVQSKLLLKFSDLKHYFFDIPDCSNLSRYAFDKKRTVEAEQLHTNKVVFIKKYNKYLKGVDGTITNARIYLGLKTADCLPIFFYDFKNNIISAVHAGWKGLVTGIVKNTLLLLRRYNVDPKNLMIAIGPHIRACCYEVSYSRIIKFRQLGLPKTIAEHRNSQWFLNLTEVAKFQLLAHGLRKESIDILPICTSCDKRFYSFRRQGKVPGVINNVIGLVAS